MGVLLVVMFIAFCCHWCADLIRTWCCIFYRYRVPGTDPEFSCIPEDV